MLVFLRFIKRGHFLNSVLVHLCAVFPQCTSCGPGLLGRCIGPDICCGARVGCFIGSRETRLCRTENMVPIRCSNADLKQCGRMQEGRCAAAGLCCTESEYYLLPCATCNACVDLTRHGSDLILLASALSFEFILSVLRSV